MQGPRMCTYKWIFKNRPQKGLKSNEINIQECLGGNIPHFYNPGEGGVGDSGMDNMIFGQDYE